MHRAQTTRRSLRLLALGVWLVCVAACDRCPDDAVRSAGPPRDHRAVTHIPADASFVAFAPDRRVLARESRAVLDSPLPLASLRTWRRAADRALGGAPLAAETWSRWGLDADASCALFARDGRWTLAAPIAHLERTRERLGPDAWSSDGLRAALPARARSGSERSDDGDDWSALVADGHTLLVTTGAGPRPALEELAPKLARPQRRWTRGDIARDGVERDALHGSWRPPRDRSALLRRAGLDGRAGMAGALLRALRRLERVDFSVRREAAQRRAVLSFEFVTDPEEPVFAGDLLGARGELPALQSAVAPGAAAVVRLSVDPESFFEMVRGSMPPDSRQALDESLRELREELAVDLRDALLDNWSGHVVAVVYGLEGTDESAPAATPAELLSLRATREAIFVPFLDGAALRRTLDIWTQLSRGRLRRRRDEARSEIHYGWFEEDTLRWAIVLRGDTAIYVDSPAAYEHARALEVPRPSLDVSLRHTGLDELLAGRDRAGFYLDLHILRSALGAQLDDELRRWLYDWETATLVTDLDGARDTAKLTLTFHER